MSFATISCSISYAFFYMRMFSVAKYFFQLKIPFVLFNFSEALNKPKTVLQKQKRFQNAVFKYTMWFFKLYNFFFFLLKLCCKLYAVVYRGFWSVYDLWYIYNLSSLLLVPVFYSINKKHIHCFHAHCNCIPLYRSSRKRETLVTKRFPSHPEKLSTV